MVKVELNKAIGKFKCLSNLNMLSFSPYLIHEAASIIYKVGDDAKDQVDENINIPKIIDYLKTNGDSSQNYGAQNFKINVMLSLYCIFKSDSEELTNNSSYHLADNLLSLSYELARGDIILNCSRSYAGLPFKEYLNNLRFYCHLNKYVEMNFLSLFKEDEYEKLQKKIKVINEYEFHFMLNMPNNINKISLEQYENAVGIYQKSKPLVEVIKSLTMMYNLVEGLDEERLNEYREDINSIIVGFCKEYDLEIIKSNNDIDKTTLNIIIMNVFSNIFNNCLKENLIEFPSIYVNKYIEIINSLCDIYKRQTKKDDFLKGILEKYSKIESIVWIANYVENIDAKIKIRDKVLNLVNKIDDLLNPKESITTKPLLFKKPHPKKPTINKNKNKKRKRVETNESEFANIRANASKRLKK